MRSILLFLLFPMVALGQQTGDFDRQVGIMNTQRSMSFHVPNDYDPANSYPLIIGLHGFSMSGGMMRNILKGIAQNRNAILVCPDGNGNRHDDEFNGAEIDLVEYTLDSCKQWYNIDESQVYLAGFSYGGRETAYYGLRHYQWFKGLITFSVAIQSSADANNNLPIPWVNPFDYFNADSIPYCNCAGADDQNFIAEIQIFDQVLSTFQALDTLHIRNGVGHTMSYPEFEADFNACLHFIDTRFGPPVGIPERNQPQFSIFPNPSNSGGTTLQFDQPVNGNLIITNQFGQEVLRRKVRGEQTIRLKELKAKGLLFIHFQSESWQLSGKLISS